MRLRGHIPVLAACAALAACQGQAPLEPFSVGGQVWPASPEAPRVQLLGQFSLPADLGIRPSLWSRLASMALGEAQDQMIRPMAVAVSDQGKRIYVADPGCGCVHRYDLRDGDYRQLRLAGEHPLASPVGMAVTPEGRLFVADSQLGRVFSALPGEDELSPVELGVELQQPTGLAWDAGLQRLYVVDTTAQLIRAFGSDGRLVSELGERGHQEGALNFPTYLWLDDAGRLLVTDTLNFRVQRFAAQGALLNSFGKPGDGTGSLARPKGVASDSFGHIYVMDALFHAMQVFDESGKLLLALGEQGQGPGQFWLPAGLFIDSDNTIYVADAYNRRVQVFRYVGGG